MKLNKSFYFTLISISCLLFSCKKEILDPHRYDSLLYQEPIVVIHKYNNLNATIDGISWQTIGTAKVDSNTITIEGNQNAQKLYFELSDFKSNNAYNINLNSPDSSSFNKGNNLYTSRNINASGIATITQLDTINKFIEGNFEFILINNTGDTSKIENGYFKISYTENTMKSIVNFGNWSSDTLWTKLDSNNTADVTDDKFIVTSIASMGGISSEIRLIFPRNFPMGSHPLTQTGNYTAYYASNINGTFSQCNSDVQNIINLSLDANTSTIHASFHFQTLNFDLIDQGKFVATY